MSGTTKHIKAVVVGDGAVGKTCLLYAYANKSFPVEYVPTVFDNYSCKIPVDGNEVVLGLWDTAGQEDYDKIRPLSYPKTSVFLLCFAVNSRASLANITQKWVKEVQIHCPGVPLVLVGTKSDIRNDNAEKASDLISVEEAQQLQQQIRAVKYTECSAKTGHNISELFHEAIKVVLINNLREEHEKKKSNSGSCCTLQ